MKPKFSNPFEAAAPAAEHTTKSSGHILCNLFCWWNLKLANKKLENENHRNDHHQNEYFQNEPIDQQSKSSKSWNDMSDIGLSE